jgi:hypothetical protein
MTDTQTLPPYAALAKGMSEAAEAVQKLAGLAVEFGERTTVATRFAFTVESAAEVDGFAAGLGAEPGWTMPWTYSAERAAGTVTVTVSFTTDPPVAPADAAAIEVPGRAA